MSAHTVFYGKLRSKTLLYYLFCAFCISLVAVNIIYSQKYNILMYGVMEGKSNSIIAYLKHISGTSLLNFEIESYKISGREDVLSQWENFQQENTIKIQKLENASLLYSYSPEIYYNLHLLYSENGNTTKAKENLLKAQQIDPLLK